MLLKQRMAVHSSGIVVTSLVTFLTWHGISALRDEQSHLQQDQESIANLVRNESEIRANHGRLFQGIQSLNVNTGNRSQISTSPLNDAEFLAQLSQLANDVDLSIKSYSPGEFTDRGLDVQLTASGTYPNVCRFLDGLETIPFLCEVPQCSIAAPQQVGEACALELSIRLLNPAQVWPNLDSTKNEP